MPGYGARFWSERTADNRRRSHPKLKGQHTADVVVIGGGLTGAATAYSLAAGGLDVVLIEAGRIAAGSTAGSLGAILPEPDAWFREVDKLAGRRASRTAWQLAQHGAADFSRAINKLNIKCDLEDAPYIVNARSMDDVQTLRKEQAARREARVTAPWITPQAVRAETELDSSGALKLAPAFVYDPVRAALGLAGAAEAKGARIFEQSAVLRTKFTRKFADVILKGATVRTKGIVVATGEPGRLFGQLRRHVRRSSGFVVVTEPLSAAMRRESGKRAALVTETAANHPWFRWLPDDRILFAGGQMPLVPARQMPKTIVAKTAQLMYELSLRYPAISGLPARWGWDTEIVTTADGLPWVGPHRNYPFHFFALGFGWHGDGLSWLAARAALRYFTDGSRREDEALGFVRHLG